MQYVLAPYALSADFKQRLEEVVGTKPTYLDYAELRRLSPPALLGRLARLGASRLLLPTEDETSRGMLPLLKSMAAVAHARAIATVDGNLAVEPVSRWAAGRAIVDVLVASGVATRDLAFCRRELDALMRSERIPAHRHAGADAADENVLYLDASLWFGMKSGGSVVHVAGVANALRARSHKVALASAVGRTLVREDIASVRLALPRVFAVPFEKGCYSFHRAVVRQLECHYGRTKPGFIYQRMSGANYSGVALSRRWQVPLVLEYNGSAVWIGKNWGNGFRYPEVAALAEDVCLRHAHLVVTVSDVLADELVARGVPRKRIVCYPNCVDPQAFDPKRFAAKDARALRAAHGIAADAPVATFIGTFGPWHGVEVFAQAIRTLVDRDSAWLESSGARFVLIGDGPNMTRVRHELSGPACARFVTLTGLVPQADAARYLAMSDVVVSPHVQNSDGSRFFGSPTKLFEYMAMEKAIIASRLEQIGAILKDGIDVRRLSAERPARDERSPAVLCEPGNSGQLAEALRLLLDLPEWRAVLGRNARTEVITRYTWDHHVSAILDGLNAVSSDTQS